MLFVSEIAKRTFPNEIIRKQKFRVTWQLRGSRRSAVRPLQSQVLITESRIRRRWRWKLLRRIWRMTCLHHRAGTVQTPLLLRLLLAGRLR